MASMKANQILDLKRSLHRDWSSASLSTRASSSSTLSRTASSATLMSRSASTATLNEWDLDSDCESFFGRSSSSAGERQESDPKGKNSSDKVVPVRRPFWKSPTARVTVVAASALVVGWMWARFIKKSSRRPAKWGHGRLALFISGFLVSIVKRLGLRGANDMLENEEAIPTQQVLACWHPHGLYVLSGLFFSAGLRNRHSRMYEWVIAGASAVFKAPLYREFALLMNARAADKAVIDSTLSTGKTVLLCPGGIHEQLETDPSQERIFFPPNLGFVRQAIKHGVPLLPIYNFGENQLYEVPSWARDFSKFLKKKFQIGFPIGIGRWGLPFVPKKQELSIRLGNVVEVGAADADPTDERVLKVFRSYCQELQRLFHAHKHDLPADVAARGLQIIWREHDSTEFNRVPSPGSSAAVVSPRPKVTALPRMRRVGRIHDLQDSSLAHSRL